MQIPLFCKCRCKYPKSAWYQNRSHLELMARRELEFVDSTSLESLPTKIGLLDISFSFAWYQLQTRVFSTFAFPCKPHYSEKYQNLVSSIFGFAAWFSTKYSRSGTCRANVEIFTSEIWENFEAMSFNVRFWGWIFW